MTQKLHVHGSKNTRKFLKVYGRKGMYMVILKVFLEFIGEMGKMTCKWLSLNFDLKYMGEMTQK